MVGDTLVLSQLKLFFLYFSITNSTGRFEHFTKPGEFTAGRFKLHFDVGLYFNHTSQATIFPFIEVSINKLGQELGDFSSNDVSSNIFSAKSKLLTYSPLSMQSAINYCLVDHKV